MVGTDTRLTTTGHWIGTVDFMAPEQFSGDEVDARADVYALGCVLYNALTGETPYPRGTVPATMLAHLHDAPPRPTDGRARACPSGFDRVIARALAKAPDDRYPSAGDLGRAALAAAEGRPVTGASAPSRAARPPRSASATRRPRSSATTVSRPSPGHALRDAQRQRPDRGHRRRPAHRAARAARAGRPRDRTRRQPRETMPLGDQPRPRAARPSRAARCWRSPPSRAGAAATRCGRADRTTTPDAETLPGAPVADGEVESLGRRFADAYGDGGHATALGRLLTRDAERVVPGARQEGRAAVARAPTATSSPTRATRSFKLSRPAGVGRRRPAARPGATSRPTRATPTSPGTITFGVLRDRGTPRIALISARQDG